MPERGLRVWTPLQSESFGWFLPAEINPANSFNYSEADVNGNDDGPVIVHCRECITKYPHEAAGRDTKQIERPPPLRPTPPILAKLDPEFLEGWCECCTHKDGFGIPCVTLESPNPEIQDIPCTGGLNQSIMLGVIDMRVLLVTLGSQH